MTVRIRSATIAQGDKRVVHLSLQDSGSERACTVDIFYSANLVRPSL